jgi:alanine dehydrogenase
MHPVSVNVDEPAVRRALDLDELRKAMAAAVADFSAGRSDQPVRTTLAVPGTDGLLALMPARTASALGTKLVTLFPNNVNRPTHHAVVLLFDPQTGEQLASLEGGSITELRTAAVSAVATDLLARPDAAVLALLGSGVQAASHLDALKRVRSFTDVRVWSPRRAADFAAAHDGVRAAESSEEAVRGADVVVTVTMAREPVLRGAWLARGAFVVAVGAPRPDWRELDDELLERARLIVDSRAAAVVESGDIRRALELGGLIDAELGEVVEGTAVGRSPDDDLVLFKSLGMAVEDVATAELILRRLATG